MKTIDFNGAKFRIFAGANNNCIKFTMTEFDQELYDIIRNYLQKKYDNNVTCYASKETYMPIPEE